MAQVMLLPNKGDTEVTILRCLTDAWNTNPGAYYAAEFITRMVYYHGTEHMHRQSAGGNRSKDIESMMLMHLAEMNPTMNKKCLRYVIYFTLWTGRVEVEHELMEPAFQKFKDTLWKPTNIYGCKGAPDMRVALFTPPHPLAKEFRATWKEFMAVCPNPRDYIKCVTGAGYYTLHGYMTGVSTPKPGKFENAIAAMKKEIERRKAAQK